jgi:hypothetical protein
MPRPPLAEFLLALLWLAALVRIFWADPILAAVSGGLLILYIVIVFARVRRQMQILSGALALLALVLAAWLDGWAALWFGVEKSVIFAAFFGTLSLLRATADLRPEIAVARRLVDRLRDDERNSGLLVGTSVLGSVLVVGVMAVFAPIVGREASYETRLAAAEACQRGMCLACLWSPFWIAMAISYEHLPQVPLWQVLTLGLSLNALGLVMAHLMYTRAVGMAGLGRALAAFVPVLPPVTLAAAVVFALNAATPLGTLQCLVLGVPVLCLVALGFQGGGRLSAAVSQSAKGMAAVRGEISLLTTAMALGQVLVVVLAASGFGAWLGALAPPAWIIFLMAVGTMTILAFAGVHQFVTATVMLVLFSTVDFGIDPLLLMMSVLLGWSFTSMTGLSAVSVAVASAMFAVPVEKVAYGQNLRFVAAFGVTGIIVLTMLDFMMS